MKNNKNASHDVMCGERLRKLRKQHGLTIAELAEKISHIPNTPFPNCSEQHLGYLERGDRSISPKYAIMFSKLFGVRLEYIQGEDEFETYDDIHKASENDQAEQYTQMAIYEDRKIFALKNILKTYDMSFEFDTSNIDGTDKTDFSIINAQYEAAIYNTPDAYSIKNDKGEILASCSYSEYMDLVEELHDFIWYKINRIIKKHNPAYFIKEE
jgi:transcriptional regulator with XRE-family HTH domain